MNNKPIALTAEEVQEIAAMLAVREMWGAEDEQEMVEWLSSDIYAVKFDYQSETVMGYVGDLYIMQGGALGEPVRLIRKNGSLRIL